MGTLIRLVRESFPGRPWLDTAISRAILLRVGRGEVPETLRLYRPDRIVAFGVQDTSGDGFAEAVERARRAGFEAVVRLAGGRAAVFHEGTLAFARTIPDPEPTARTYARFEEMADIMSSAMRRVGVDARVGEVDGEYCPGGYSVNARGTKKIVGIGQRIVSGAAHVGGVVVAEGSSEVREVLIPVYSALRLDWDPSTVGSVIDESGAGWTEVEKAILDELSGRFEIEEGEIDRETVSMAESLEDDHRPESRLRPGRPGVPRSG